MITALYAGSFDPFTLGHLDVLESSTKIFDSVIVAVAYNNNKQCLLSVEDRVNIIKDCTKHIKNVKVTSYEGLTVTFAKQAGATVLIRGIRSVSDCENEIRIALNNALLDKNIQTIFLPTNPEYSFISSSGVKEIYFNNGDISKLVPQEVITYLKNQ